MTALRWLPLGILALAASATAAPDPIQVHCRVFLDADESGTYDVGESPLAGVRVINGVSATVTNALGEADLTVDRAVYRFATLQIPAGHWPTNSWFHHVPVGHAGPDTVDFGLRIRPETAADVPELRWIHIGDTQVQGPTEPYRMDLDMQDINEMPDPPLFLVNCGDLVETGPDTTHWSHYVAQRDVCDHEIFPVVGNHDIIPTATPLDYYEKWAGPPYYSFDAGKWHFVVYNGSKNLVDGATPSQDTWLAQDLAQRPPGSFVYTFQHYTLPETETSKITSWVAGGVKANFSGHWHSNQIADRPYGITDYNISWTRNGAVDHTPRVYGIVTSRPDGTQSYELRRLGVNHRTFVASPRVDQVVGREALEVAVQAYDSASPVAWMNVVVSGSSLALPPAAMSPEGVSLWRTVVDATTLGTGEVDITVSGAFEDGTPISLVSSCTLADDVPIVRAPNTDWPMFRRCSAGSSFVPLHVDLPLAVAWSRQVPGLVAMSSPVVAGGRVFIGCRAEREVTDAGVMALDAATGNPLWFRHIPSGVSLAPAVAGDIVLVTSMSDSVYGLSASTGSRVWAIPQIEGKYTLTAPIVEGGSAWVGTEPKPHQINPATGAIQWISANIGNPWYPVMYSAPAVGPNHIFFSFFGWEDLPSGGFKIVNRSNGTLAYGEPGCFRSSLWANGTLYVVGAIDRNSQRLSARDALGNILWMSPKDMGAGVGPPALAYGTIVVPGKSGGIEAFRASDGLNLWTKAVGKQMYDMEVGWGTVKATPGAPAIADHTVFEGSLDGNLYALDLDSGAELWRHEFGVPVGSSVAVSGNMIFVAAEDEHLYAFASGSPSTPTAAGVLPGAPSTSLLPPRPNPSRGNVTLAFVLGRTAKVRVDIVDVAGRRIRTAWNGPLEAGRHELQWDGRDKQGRLAASGVYWVRLRTDGQTLTKKLVRLRS